MRPDIEQVGGDTEKVREALYKALERAWVLIEPKIIKDLVRSMEKQVKAVIAADGWYTKY